MNGSIQLFFLNKFGSVSLWTASETSDAGKRECLKINLKFMFLPSGESCLVPFLSRKALHLTCSCDIKAKGVMPGCYFGDSICLSLQRIQPQFFLVLLCSPPPLADILGSHQ